MDDLKKVAQDIAAARNLGCHCEHCRVYRAELTDKQNHLLAVKRAFDAALVRPLGGQAAEKVEPTLSSKVELCHWSHQPLQSCKCSECVERRATDLKIWEGTAEQVAEALSHGKPGVTQVWVNEARDLTDLDSSLAQNAYDRGLAKLNVAAAVERLQDEPPPYMDLGHLPADAAERKATPLATGVLDYFPDALIAVAQLSKIGNDQHNPGKPLFWDRTKSTDEADCLARHFIDRGTRDTDGVRHSAKVAWRALALLQKEIENEA